MAQIRETKRNRTEHRTRTSTMLVRGNGSRADQWDRIVATVVYYQLAKSIKRLQRRLHGLSSSSCGLPRAAVFRPLPAWPSMPVVGAAARLVLFLGYAEKTSNEDSSHSVRPTRTGHCQNVEKKYGMTQKEREKKAFPNPGRATSQLVKLVKHHGHSYNVKKRRREKNAPAAFSSTHRASSRTTPC